MLRTMFLLLLALRLSAAVPAAAADLRFGQLIGTEATASAWDPATGDLFIGGLFTGWQQPDGFGGTTTVTRGNLCSLAANGSMRTWNPTTDGQIYGMRVVGTTLYISGYFSQVNGEPRALVAALSTVDGTLLPFDAGLVGTIVNDLVVVDDLLYIGGAFTQVDGQPRSWVAAVDATTGAVATWNPGVSGGQGVTAMAASGSAIYIGGWFTTVGGQPRANAAAVDTDGTLLAWNPAASGSENSGHLKDLQVAHGAVFAGGYFETIGGVARSRLAALDPATGLDLGWDVPCNDEVFSISPTPTGLAIGGSFTSIDGQARQGRALVTSAGAVTAWTPSPGETFYTIATGNDAVFGGAGTFRAHIPADASPSDSVNVNAPDRIATLGGIAYFGGATSGHGRELWSTDGTVAGTSRVRDIVRGTVGSGPKRHTVMGGKVYFSANDGGSGRELWVTDGTEAGTRLVKDIAAGAHSSNPDHLYALGSLLVFTAYQPGIGYSMWATDGTTAGTVMINDVEPANTADEYSYNWDGTYCVVGSTLYFNATNATHGSALWITDGTALGSRVVKNTTPGGPGTQPIAMTTMGGKLYFTSRYGSSRLWVSDGTDAGTVEYTAVLRHCDFNAAINGLVYTRGTTDSLSNGIWVTDGDPAHLTLLSTTLTAPSFFVERGGLAYTNVDAPSPHPDRPLVGSDGTPGGTTVLSAVRAHILYTVGSTLYFSSPIGSGAHLWKSDGTAGGTVEVTDRISDAAAVGQVSGLVLVGQRSDWNSYSELWSSNGDDAGTVRLLPGSSITITSPTSATTWATTLTELPIIGSAESDAGIDSVSYSLSGATTGSGTASGTTAWSFTPTLALGVTTVTVTAQCADGNDALDVLTVMVQAESPTAPTIAVALPTATTAWLSTVANVQIGGSAAGSAALASVTYTLSGATTGTGTATGTDAWAFTAALNPGQTAVTVMVEDANGDTGTDALIVSCDLALPTIAIVTPAATGTHGTSEPTIAITGTASDDAGIASVSYGLSGATTGSGTASGSTAWAFTTPTLAQGTTVVTVIAHDLAGRTASASLVIERMAVADRTENDRKPCGFGSTFAVLLLLFLALRGRLR